MACTLYVRDSQHAYLWLADLAAGTACCNSACWSATAARKASLPLGDSNPPVTPLLRVVLALFGDCLLSASRLAGPAAGAVMAARWFRLWRCCDASGAANPNRDCLS